MNAETDTEQLILMLRSVQAVAARVDTIEHCSFAGPDRKYGSDFNPAVVRRSTPRADTPVRP